MESNWLLNDLKITGGRRSKPGALFVFSDLIATLISCSSIGWSSVSSVSTSDVTGFTLGPISLIISFSSAAHMNFLS